MTAPQACFLCGLAFAARDVRVRRVNYRGGADDYAHESHFEDPVAEGFLVEPEYELAPAFLEPPLICTRQGCIAPRVPSLHHCAEHTREFAAFLNDPANFKRPSGLSDEQRRQVGSMIAGAIKGHCAERFAKIERKIAATNRLLASRVAQIFGSIKFLAGKKRTDALPQPTNTDNAPSREGAQADASSAGAREDSRGGALSSDPEFVAAFDALDKSECKGWCAKRSDLHDALECPRPALVSRLRKIRDARAAVPASEPVDVVKLRDEALEEAALVLDALAKEADSQLGAIHHQGGTDEEFDEAFGSREALEAAAGYVRRKKSDAISEVSRSIDSTLSADVKTESERAS